ncbi:MAG: hypothetical protein Q8J64_06520 [Thermodesulfovibrionales bacterium]|nr:hypothetical protein [Thermodesulfovibrionales bacterium]
MSVAVAKKKVKADGFSVTDVLATASAPAKKESGSKAPVLMVGEDVKKLASKVRELKAELDSIEAMYEARAAELIEKVASQREALCKSGYVSAVRVPDSGGLSVGVSWSSNYSKVGMENADTLKGIAGKGFEDYFTTEMSISVKDVSEDALSELILLEFLCGFRFS